MVPITTLGDTNNSGALRELGQGAFTREVDQAVADGDVDIGVHSLKDGPVHLDPAVQLVCVLPRDDPRDVLIGAKQLTSLGEREQVTYPLGARVGTSSMRRKAQILHSYPHLHVVPIRGNVNARLQLLETGTIDATVLALSGLRRLGRCDVMSAVLPLHDMVPAACQGVVGVTCRAGDEDIARCLADGVDMCANVWQTWTLSSINHEPTFLEVSCERAFLRQLMPC
eukprot:jgi/Chrzof1/9701/Cz04g12200.t1_PBGD2[v5.2]